VKEGPMRFGDLWACFKEWVLFWPQAHGSWQWKSNPTIHVWWSVTYYGFNVMLIWHFVPLLNKRAARIHTIRIEAYLLFSYIYMHYNPISYVGLEYFLTIVVIDPWTCPTTTPRRWTLISMQL
jgi:hypothetical protein